MGQRLDRLNFTILRSILWILAVAMILRDKPAPADHGSV